MSLITRCPACGTMFKVVPDQLRISEGWVRCGHCSEVFDASANLHNEVPATEPGVLVPQAAPPPAATAAPKHPDPGPESEAFASSLNTEIDEIQVSPPDSVMLAAEARFLIEDPRDQPFELRRQDGAIVETQPSQLEPELDSVLEDVSFVRDARRKAFWGSPRVRAASIAGLVGLALLLLLQVAVHDRDRLAASDPSLRPWLTRVCGLLNCAIMPPRQIDAIAIESSSFNKLRGDAYRLNVTLKNQANVPVALPALELTLTDVQDQAVVRRVLQPADLGSTSDVVSPASEWSGSLTLAVAPNGAGRIAGYRLLAFYP